MEVLDASMKEVYDGNLEAYVEPEAYQGEIDRFKLSKDTGGLHGGVKDRQGKG